MSALEITAPLTMYALYIGIDLRHAETSAALTSILKRHVLAWSIFTGNGCFQGEEEVMCQVHVGLPDLAVAVQIAAEIREHFVQHGVGIVELGPFRRVMG
jgi:hypothetical protein